MKKIILLMCLVTFGMEAFSQGSKKYFSDPVEVFSKKKTAYITLSNGDEIQGTIKKLKRTKGLFNEVRLTINGKVKNIDAADIQSMYLPQSNWDKFATGFVTLGDATRWTSNLNQERLKDGYAYFEKTEVNYRKKKTDVLLLQLLNPAFTNIVKIYHDPLAMETGGLSVGGIQVSGGDDKSYFLKQGDAVAYRLKKKNLDDNESKIFSDCKDVHKEVAGKRMTWGEFPKALYEYSAACGQE